MYPYGPKSKCGVNGSPLIGCLLRTKVLHGPNLLVDPEGTRYYSDRREALLFGRIGDVERQNNGGPRSLRELPPVILHPFDVRAEPGTPVEGTIGSPADQRYFESRFAELRMLSFLGRDLDRWVSQCAEMTREIPGLEEVTEGSFISLLLFDPPSAVTQKMTEWGIDNYQIVFSRALGLNMIYPFPPPANSLSEPLLRNFHLYADTLFDLRLKMSGGAELQGQKCAFDIYASREYSSLLERSWNKPEN